MGINFRAIGLIVFDSYSIMEPLGFFLTGYAMYQYGYYMRQDVAEPWLHKVLATVAMLSCIALSMSDCALLLHDFEQILWDPAGSKPSIANAIGTILTTLCGLSIQIYYSRVAAKMMSKPRPWIIISSILIAITTFGSIMTTRSFVYSSTHGLKQSLYIFTGVDLIWYTLWLGSSAVLDLTLSGILCYKFWGSKRESTFGATTSVLTKLLISTIETFTMSSMAALTSLALNCIIFAIEGIAIPRLEMAAAFINTLLARFYVISLLFTLNRKAALRDQLRQPRTSVAPIPLSKVTVPTPTVSGTQLVYIATTTTTKCDV